ncbi:hypothetical protein ACH5RR_015178 [Cinchona calisaya]|uniref:Pentatricopeptide repeat-containing protein n=1 Tax=Cinchona calisaya TaxID=153742 RepID=A0ABD2ZSG0_9GENT
MSIPLVASLIILIKALCKNSEMIEAALNNFLGMPKHGLLQIHTHLSNSMDYGLPRSHVIACGDEEQSTLIHGLCKEGKLSEALEIFDRMKLQGLYMMQVCTGKLSMLFVILASSWMWQTFSMKWFLVESPLIE